jgi:hypothetical protein
MGFNRIGKALESGHDARNVLWIIIESIDEKAKDTVFQLNIRDNLAVVAIDSSIQFLLKVFDTMLLQSNAMESMLRGPRVGTVSCPRICIADHAA